METTPEVLDNPSEHRFELTIGADTAVAEYRVDGPVIDFVHTFVPEGLRGRGIATRLVEAALASARARGLRVTPTCTTFVGYIKSHPETHDLLTDAARKSIAAA